MSCHTYNLYECIINMTYEYFVKYPLTFLEYSSYLKCFENYLTFTFTARFGGSPKLADQRLNCIDADCIYRILNFVSDITENISLFHSFREFSYVRRTDVPRAFLGSKLSRDFASFRAHQLDSQTNGRA